MWELVGVPYTSMAEPGGIANAISVYRELDLAERLAGLGATDGGDMVLQPPSGTRGRSGLLNEEALDHLFQVTHATVQTVRDRGHTPLMLGGDCPVLLGGLAALGGPESAGLVMIDGHEDAWPPELSDTGEGSDSELGIALGSVADLPPALAEATPLVAGRNVDLLGPRDSEELSTAGVDTVRDGIVFFADARDTQTSLAAGHNPAQQALEAVGADAFWLHVDLDVLATDAFGAVDYRQPGGLDWAELDRLAATAAGDPRCHGVSVVIYNPDLDPDRSDGKKVVDFVGRLID
jgi:arginase